MGGRLNRNRQVQVGERVPFILLRKILDPILTNPEEGGGRSRQTALPPTLKIYAMSLTSKTGDGDERVQDLNIMELKSINISSKQNWYKIIQSFSANRPQLKANKTGN